MPEPASPATTLQRVVVTHEQRRTVWRAGRATIRDGKIIIRTSKRTPPADLFDGHTSTYTIVAADGGLRTRRFDGVKLDREATVQGKKYVFV